MWSLRLQPHFRLPGFPALSGATPAHRTAEPLARQPVPQLCAGAPPGRTCVPPLNKLGAASGQLAHGRLPVSGWAFTGMKQPWIHIYRNGHWLGRTGCTCAGTMFGRYTLGLAGQTRAGGWTWTFARGPTAHRLDIFLETAPEAFASGHTPCADRHDTSWTTQPGTANLGAKARLVPTSIPRPAGMFGQREHAHRATNPVLQPPG